MKSVVRPAKLRQTLNVAVIGLCVFAAAKLGGQGVRMPAASQASAGPDRYLTYVSTDKPVYRTGEKVYVRGFVLRAEGHAPGATGVRTPCPPSFAAAKTHRPTTTTFNV